MFYYFKRINAEGKAISVTKCNRHLKESRTQIEITETEYAELYAALSQPEMPEYDDPNLIIDILTGEVE